MLRILTIVALVLAAAIATSAAIAVAPRHGAAIEKGKSFVTRDNPPVRLVQMR